MNVGPVVPCCTIIYIKMTNQSKIFNKRAASCCLWFRKANLFKGRDLPFRCQEPPPPSPRGSLPGFSCLVKTFAAETCTFRREWVMVWAGLGQNWVENGRLVSAVLPEDRRLARWRHPGWPLTLSSQDHGQLLRVQGCRKRDCILLAGKDCLHLAVQRKIDRTL